MTNKTLYTKIFNFLKKKFDIKDICVRFWSGRATPYKCVPYVVVIDNNEKEHCLTIDDKYHMFDYVYVYKFEKVVIEALHQNQHQRRMLRNGV